MVKYLWRDVVISHEGSQQVQELSTDQAIMCQQLLPVEPPAGNTLLPLPFLLSPTHVQRVQADKGDIEDVEVGVVADDRTVVGDGHLGDDMVCLKGALNNLKSKI